MMISITFASFNIINLYLFLKRKRWPKLIEISLFKYNYITKACASQFLSDHKMIQINIAN